MGHEVIWKQRRTHVRLTLRVSNGKLIGKQAEFNVTTLVVFVETCTEIGEIRLVER